MIKKATAATKRAKRFDSMRSFVPALTEQCLSTLIKMPRVSSRVCLPFLLRRLATLYHTMKPDHTQQKEMKKKIRIKLNLIRLVAQFLKDVVEKGLTKGWSRTEPCCNLVSGDPGSPLTWLWLWWMHDGYTAPCFHARYPRSHQLLELSEPITPTHTTRN